jgi:hypothetical protein
MAYITAKKRKQIEDGRWSFILQRIEEELQRRKQRRPTTRAVELLEALRKAASKRDGVGMLNIAQKYVRLTRTLPPGVYAFAPGQQRVTYMDCDRLDKGVRCSILQMGIVHAQIYR